MPDSQDVRLIKSNILSLYQRWRMGRAQQNEVTELMAEYQQSASSSSSRDSDHIDKLYEMTSYFELRGSLSNNLATLHEPVDHRQARVKTRTILQQADLLRGLISSHIALLNHDLPLLAEVDLAIEDQCSSAPAPQPSPPQPRFPPSPPSVASPERAHTLERSFRSVGSAPPLAPPPPNHTPYGYVSHPTHARLEKESLPVFSGHLLDYPDFRESVSRLLINNVVITDPAEKISRLKRALPYHLRSSLTHLQRTESDFQQAIRILDNTCGHPSALANALIHQLDSRAELTFKSPLPLYQQYRDWIYRAQAVIGIDPRQEIKLIEHLSAKLSEEIATFALGHGPMNLSQIGRYLDSAIDGKQRRAALKSVSKPVKENRSEQSRAAPRSLVNAVVAPPPSPCLFCGENHWCRECPLSIEARKAKLIEAKRCLRCFRVAGGQHKCKRKCRRCNSENHGHLLCPQTEAKEIAPAAPSVACAVSAVSKERLPINYLGVLHVKLACHPDHPPLYALYDLGSQVSMISSSAVDKWKLSTKRASKRNVVGFGNSNHVASQIVRTSLIGDSGSQCGPGDLLVGPTSLLASSLPPIPPHVMQKAQDLGLNLATPSITEPIHIDIILGHDWYMDHLRVSIDQRRDVEVFSGFEATPTTLGHVIHGRGTVLNYESSMVSLPLLEANHHLKVIHQAEEAPDIDNLGAWESNYKDRVQYDPNVKRLIAPLPWISADRPPTNSRMIIARTRQLRDRLNQTNRLAAYDKALATFHQEGSTELVFGPDRFQGHFLYHFPVWKEGSTTPVRPVFDASFAARGQTSLNDHLFKGDTSGLDLPRILIHWRLHPHVLFADIRKAFLQIRVAAEDRPYLRYCWFNDDRLEVFQFTSVMFGANASPAILKVALQKLLESTPEVDASLIYMDDMLFTADSLDELTNKLRIASNKLRSASLELHKLAAVPEVVEKVSKELTSATFLPSTVTKALGLTWNHCSDAVSFTPLSLPDQHTKRGAASCLAKLFDPLGLWLPFQLQLREYMSKIQDIARWDDGLPIAMVDRLRKLVEESKGMINFEIPRRVSNGGPITCRIFADASKMAYGAAAYVYQNQQGRLLCAKGHLVSASPRTIPQLELCAAVVAAGLYKQLVQHLPQCEFILYTDSMTTMQRILNSPNALPPFEAHRLLKIHQTTPRDLWNHVPTRFNPADVLSRTATVSQLKKNRLWWDGPSPDDLKAPIPAVSLSITAPIDLKSSTNILDRISNMKFHNAFLIIEIMLGALQRRYNLAQRGESINPLVHLFRLLQRHLLATQYDAVKNGARLSSVSRDNIDHLYLDSDGLLRERKRLERAEITEPIVLPECPLVESFFQSEHIRLFHAGRDRTYLELKARYKVAGLWKVVDRIVKKCIYCNRFRSHPFSIPTPPLPEERVTASRPFEVVGVDLFKVNLDKTTSTQVMIFACTKIRAIHLEIVGKKDLSSVHLGIRRFVSLFGAPKKFISDNEKSFKAFALVIKTSDGHEPLEWQFNRPLSPWMGGFYERLIGSVKSALNPYLRSIKKVDIEEFRTVIAEVCNFVNNRPLISTSGQSYLCPNDFIRGYRKSSLPDPNPGPSNLRDLYYRLSRRLNGRWTQWLRLYLPTLKRHHEGNGRTPCVGELVLVSNPAIPRGSWPLAVISDFTGEDRRGAHVKMLDGSKHLRSTRTLIPLELPSNPPPPEELSQRATTPLDGAVSGGRKVAQKSKVID